MLQQICIAYSRVILFLLLVLEVPKVYYMFPLNNSYHLFPQFDSLGMILKSSKLWLLLHSINSIVYSISLSVCILFKINPDNNFVDNTHTLFVFLIFSNFYRLLFLSQEYATIVNLTAVAFLQFFKNRWNLHGSSGISYYLFGSLFVLTIPVWGTVGKMISVII